MKENMAKKGHHQGDMSPTVSDYELPHKAFAESGFGETTHYIERSDKRQDKMASDIRKQHYKGRYS